MMERVHRCESAPLCSCGRKALHVETLGRKLHHLECPPCRVRTAKCKSLADAIAAWIAPNKTALIRLKAA